MKEPIYEVSCIVIGSKCTVMRSTSQLVDVVTIDSVTSLSPCVYTVQCGPVAGEAKRHFLRPELAARWATRVDEQSVPGEKPARSSVGRWPYEQRDKFKQRRRRRVTATMNVVRCSRVKPRLHHHIRRTELKWISTGKTTLDRVTILANPQPWILTLTYILDYNCLQAIITKNAAKNPGHSLARLCQKCRHPSHYQPWATTFIHH